MLISLLVLSREQIYVPIWVKHGSSYRGPITLLDPLVELVGNHKKLKKISRVRLDDGYVMEKGGDLSKGLIPEIGL